MALKLAIVQSVPHVASKFCRVICMKTLVELAARWPPEAGWDRLLSRSCFSGSRVGVGWPGPQTPHAPGSVPRSVAGSDSHPLLLLCPWSTRLFRLKQEPDVQLKRKQLQEQRCKSKSVVNKPAHQQDALTRSQRYTQGVCVCVCVCVQ